MVTNKGAPFLSLFVVIVSVNSRSGKTVSKRPRCGGANNEDCKAFDILLLDIQMKEMNGLEMAKRIRMQNSDIQIIFITGYPDFMSEGHP